MSQHAKSIPPALDQVWSDAFGDMEDTANRYHKYAVRAARMGAYESAERLGTIAQGLDALAEQIEDGTCPDWLMNVAEARTVGRGS